MSVCARAHHEANTRADHSSGQPHRLHRLPSHCQIASINRFTLPHQLPWLYRGVSTLGMDYIQYKYSRAEENRAGLDSCLTRQESCPPFIPFNYFSFFSLSAIFWRYRSDPTVPWTGRVEPCALVEGFFRPNSWSSFFRMASSFLTCRFLAMSDADGDPLPAFARASGRFPVLLDGDGRLLRFRVGVPFLW